MSNNKIPKEFVYLDEYYLKNILKNKPNIDEIQQNLRYATNDNFTGSVVNGYSLHSRAVLTIKAAEALYRAQEVALDLGFSLLVYDSYRPQKAVNCFIEWAESSDDSSECKQCYYPALKRKTDAFELPDRYVAKQSGHSRGSTVDITLIERGLKVKQIEKIERVLKNGQKVVYMNDGSVDMYTSFDLMDRCSWHQSSHLIEDLYCRNRSLLKDILIGCGFIPLEREWWHYSLADEPFPNTYFDFDF